MTTQACVYCGEVLATDSSAEPICWSCRGQMCVHGTPPREVCEDCDQEELSSRAEAEWEPDSWLDREEHLDWLECKEREGW